LGIKTRPVRIDDSPRTDEPALHPVNAAVLPDHNAVPVLHRRCEDRYDDQPVLAGVLRGMDLGHRVEMNGPGADDVDPLAVDEHFSRPFAGTDRFVAGLAVMLDFRAFRQPRHAEGDAVVPGDVDHLELVGRLRRLSALRFQRTLL